MDRPAALMDRARTATGLADFGDDGFREGLDRLVRAIDGEARLNARGQMGMDAQIIDLLANRLQVEHWYRLHPEIDEQRIVAPLIGLGLPRSGSTALSCLLAADPAARSIRGWEAMAPCPPPETATEADDPRIARAEQAMIRRAQTFPRMTMMLPSTATTPTECQTFMGFTFKTQLFQAFAHIPSYMHWLNHDADMVPAYAYVKRVLKLLQWRCPPYRWRLKNPAHILFITALDEVFPDARYWMTHRDIASVIPSGADLYLELHQAFADDVDKAYLGRLHAEVWELGMRRLIAFRDAGRDHRFFDVHFAPFQRDPMPVLERLYAFLGEELTAGARARMDAWRRDTPREKNGDHRYDPADFGIDIDRLRERFRFYSDRFGVSADGRAA